MDFEEALIAELDTITELSGKVFPLVARKRDAAGQTVAAPYATFISSDGKLDKTINGFLNSKSVEVEFNVIATSYAEMSGLSARVMPLLISFEQRVIGDAGPFIEELTYDEPDKIYEQQTGLFRWNIIFKVYI